nr:putative nadph-dependent quinone reductase tdic [Quercus suber]
MRQAQVTAWGDAPKCIDVSELPPPGPGEVRIKVLAVGVHQVVRSRASGTHYTSGSLPHVPGVDGTGTTEDGQLVYFSSFQIEAMSQYVNMDRRRLRPLPEGVDPVQAAGIINPIMSSWMALTTRTIGLPKEFHVLVLGATSASGRCALSVARALGAKRVVGAARNQQSLDSLGFDETIVISDNAENVDFSTIEDIDVIIDYLYGPITVQMFKTLPIAKSTQYVHVGGLAGQEIKLPGAVLRSKQLTIRGSGPGAWSMEQLGQTAGQMLDVLKVIPEQPIKVAKLEDVEEAWDEPTQARLVIVM